MKKTYIAPTCAAYTTPSAPLCASVVIKDTTVSGEEGNWTRPFGTTIFDKDEETDEN